MLTVLMFLLIAALVAVVPVMIGARMVGAQKTGFGPALLGVIVLAFVSAVVRWSEINSFVGFVISSVVGGFALAHILGTTFWRAIVVSIIATVIQVIAVVVLAGTMLTSLVAR
jgi:uncharacterized membrane protein YvlD (DUF360 family)